MRSIGSHSTSVMEKEESRRGCGRTSKEELKTVFLIRRSRQYVPPCDAEQANSVVDRWPDEFPLHRKVFCKLYGQLANWSLTKYTLNTNHWPRSVKFYNTEKYINTCSSHTKTYELYPKQRKVKTLPSSGRTVNSPNKINFRKLFEILFHFELVSIM